MKELTGQSIDYRCRHINNEQYQQWEHSISATAEFDLRSSDDAIKILFNENPYRQMIRCNIVHPSYGIIVKFEGDAQAVNKY